MKRLPYTLSVIAILIIYGLSILSLLGMIACLVGLFNQINF